MVGKMNKKVVLKTIFYVIFIVLLFILLLIYFRNYINTNRINNTVPVNHKIIKDTSDNSEDEFYSQFSEDVDLDYYRNYYSNNDIIGRLEIPGVFNIFITQSDDNEYYLNHSIYKKTNAFGNEFLDYRVDPTSKQVNIYGHNSRTYSTSFKKLENYLNYDFYLNNQYILLQHDNGHRIYKIFAFKQVLTDFEHMLTNVISDEFTSHIDALKKDTMYQTEVEYSNDSNIIILQTCSYNEGKSYYIIMGIEI